MDARKKTHPIFSSKLLRGRQYVEQLALRAGLAPKIHQVAAVIILFTIALVFSAINLTNATS